MGLLPIALLVAVAAAQGAPMKPVAARDVTIKRVVDRSTDRPLGSMNVKLNPSGDLLDVSFLNFTAEVGPDAPPDNHWEDCGAIIFFKFPKGLMFHVMEITYRGFAKLSSGQRATFETSYQDLATDQVLTSSATLEGPMNGKYLSTKPTRSYFWYNCRPTAAVLAMSTTVLIYPADGMENGHVMVDPDDGLYDVKLGLEWRDCSDDV